MGIDADISLPPNVRLHDVAVVLAALYGHEVRRSKRGSAQCIGVALTSSSHVPQCAWIKIPPVPRFGRPAMQVLYHFELEKGRRGLGFRSWPLAIAMLKRLADFFGGNVDYNDCDSNAHDYERPDRDDVANCPDDGEPWEDLQDRMAAVKAVTREEIAECRRFAAYNEDE